MKKYLIHAFFLSFLSCSTYEQERLQKENYEAIIEAGIVGKTPVDFKTKKSFPNDKLLILDHYLDSVQLPIDYHLIKSESLPIRIFDSLKSVNSNADFWSGLKSLYPQQEFLLTFTKPIVKKDTVTFQYTWQSMDKGSGKRFLMTCVMKDSTWSFVEQEMLLAF